MINNIILNWRFWVMAAIAAVAIMNLFGVPQPDDANYWLLMVYSKFTAAVLIYFDVRLFVWFAKHRQIDDILNFINEDN